MGSKRGLMKALGEDWVEWIEGQWKSKIHKGIVTRTPRGYYCYVWREYEGYSTYTGIGIRKTLKEAKEWVDICAGPDDA